MTSVSNYPECPKCGVGWCFGECQPAEIEEAIGDQINLGNVDDNFHSAVFPDPRPFQTKTIESLREGWRQGHRLQMVMAPTGAGKTDLAMRIMAKALQNGKRAIFAVDRLAIMGQTSQVADKYGLPHGIIQAGNPRRRSSRFQIASILTIAKRGWPVSDMLVIDEAHIRGPWIKHVLASGAYVIGLSATPFAEGLGAVFSRLINAVTMAELVKSEVLVPMRTFVCQEIDMTGAARTSPKGEWTPVAQEERGMKVVGDIVSDWSRFRNPDTPKTVAFGATIAHCNKITREFNEAGIPAATFCAETSEHEREVLLKEYRKTDSKLHVLVSVDAIARGFDVPDVGTISMARPLSKSLSAYMQMIGRGMRSSPGKTSLRLLDHSGNSERFKEDFSTIYWEGLDKLDDGKKLDAKIRKEPKNKGAKCRNCGYEPCGRRCISCGYEYIAPSLEKHAAGRMLEFEVGNKPVGNKSYVWAQSVTLCREHGKPDTAPQRAAWLYRSVVGVWPKGLPDFRDTPDVLVSSAMRNKLKANRIAYVHSKAK